jgi:capsule polysaccharide export protein KpsE/RkpR
MSYHEILNTIIFYRTPILKITALSSIFLFFILLFIYPVSYEAPVTILPPEKNNQMGGLGSLLGGDDISGLLTSGFTNANSQLFMEVLKSRTASLYVVKKHDLVKFYNVDNDLEAAKKLSERLKLDLSKEGIISLSVNTSTSLFPFFTSQKDSMKILSSALSNSFVKALDLINREKLSSKAKRARIYIESQLEQTKKMLDSAENSLMLFQRKNKTVSLPEQVKAAIDAAADLKTDIIKTEIELGMLQPNLQENSKTLLTLKNRLQELRNQYNKMEMGNQDYLVAFKDVPEVGRELAKLLREVKIQNEVYILLQQQYFKEKIQENRDLPTVEVLDEAIPPLNASSPRLIVSTILGGIFVFLLMSLLYIIIEMKKLNYIKKSEDS